MLRVNRSICLGNNLKVPIIALNEGHVEHLNIVINVIELPTQ